MSPLEPGWTDSTCSPLSPLGPGTVVLIEWGTSAVLFSPPSTTEWLADAVFFSPPIASPYIPATPELLATHHLECCPDAIPASPPSIAELGPAPWCSCPPTTVAFFPEAAFFSPPRIEECSPRPRWLPRPPPSLSSPGGFFRRPKSRNASREATLSAPANHRGVRPPSWFCSPRPRRALPEARCMPRLHRGVGTGDHVAALRRQRAPGRVALIPSHHQTVAAGPVVAFEVLVVADARIAPAVRRPPVWPRRSRPEGWCP